MANKEHLDILKKGVDEWNKWRKTNPSIVLNHIRVDLSQAALSSANLSQADLYRANLTEVDLSQADLSSANLTEVDLSQADLSSANLSKADLSRANLTEVDLSQADLSSANLSKAGLSRANLYRANLSRVDLSRANLSRANLSRANLSRANLTKADLTKANLTGAILYYTVFGDINLVKTVGIDSCTFMGPSIIDHQTLQESGPLPIKFLRGCGLPDTFIEYIPSIFNRPIEYYSCFISYSSKDEDFAQRLHADLQDKGVRCWFAPKDMKTGDRIRDAIEGAIRVHEKLLIILSADSINSMWVEDEVDAAMSKETTDKTVLFPIRLDNAVMDSKKGWAAKVRRSRHIANFENWKNHDNYKKAFDRLMRDLKAES